MKAITRKCAFPRKLPKVLALLSPKVNALCIIKKRVAEVLQPSCNLCHQNFNIHHNSYFAQKRLEILRQTPRRFTSNT